MSHPMTNIKMVSMMMSINMITRCEERSRGGPCPSLGNTSSGPDGSTSQPASIPGVVFVLQEVFCWFYTHGCFCLTDDGTGTKCTAPGVR